MPSLRFIQKGLSCCSPLTVNAQWTSVMAGFFCTGNRCKARAATNALQPDGVSQMKSNCSQLRYIARIFLRPSLIALLHTIACTNAMLLVAFITDH